MMFSFPYESEQSLFSCQLCIKPICYSFVDEKIIPEFAFFIAIIIGGRTPAQIIRIQAQVAERQRINRLFFFDPTTSTLKRI